MCFMYRWKKRNKRNYKEFNILLILGIIMIILKKRGWRGNKVLSEQDIEINVI